MIPSASNTAISRTASASVWAAARYLQGGAAAGTCTATATLLRASPALFLSNNWATCQSRNKSSASSAAEAIADEEPTKTKATSDRNRYSLNEDGDVVVSNKKRSSPDLLKSDDAEFISFPPTSDDADQKGIESQPLLLNAKEHVVGYLSRILNARVYDAAVETDLQHAKNLSTVRLRAMPVSFVGTYCYCSIFSIFLFALLLI